MKKQRMVKGFTVYEDDVDNKWVYGFGVSEYEFSEEYAKEIGRKSDWMLYTDNGVYRVDGDSISWEIGLYDAKGIMIFEGDIWTNGNTNYLVEFDEYYRNYNPFNKYSATCNCYPYEDDSYISSRGLVIGNKYQNSNMISNEGWN